MATAHPLPAPVAGLPSQAEVKAADVAVSERALVPQQQQEAEGSQIALTAPLGRLPVELDVAVPVRSFRVRNLLALESGQVIETEWAHGEDMPLASGDVQLAWTEFEVIDAQLAVRITRLS